MNDILTIVFSALGTIITGLAAWLTTFLVNLINTKIKDKKLASLMSQITEIVMRAVEATFQTYVDALKKQGKFGAEEQKEALKRALQLCLAQLSDEAKAFIEKNHGDIKEWLTGQIESCIYQLKR